MPDCPLADECPNFSEQIEGMGCQHYGDRGGMEWCSHYSQPINDLKTAPVVPGQEVVVEVDDMHESGAGVGHHADSGFVVMVDGVLPPARAKVKITNVKSNYAQADLVEKLPEEPEEGEGGEGEEAAEGAEGEEEAEEAEEEKTSKRSAEESRPLGSRDNFWGS